MLNTVRFYPYFHLLKPSPRAGLNKGKPRLGIGKSSKVKERLGEASGSGGGSGNGPSNEGSNPVKGDRTKEVFRRTHAAAEESKTNGVVSNGDIANCHDQPEDSSLADPDKPKDADCTRSCGSCECGKEKSVKITLKKSIGTIDKSLLDF